MTGLLALAGGYPSNFVLFGPAHLGVFVVLAVVLVVMVWLARDRRRSDACLKAELALAMVLLWSYPAKSLSSYYGGVGMSAPIIPMHLCDWAAAAAFFALVLRRYWMAELAYFWGLAGTLQGLVTPNLDIGFPHPVWFAFFQLHGGVVLAALYLVFGCGWRPNKGAILRVWLLGNLYLALAGIVNLFSVHSNYAFLREKPAAGSLMDVLGPWPIYIISMQAVALVVFTLLDLPFWRGRRMRMQRQP